MTGPWRVLVLDASGDDPKWLIATVTEPEDVRPALIQDGRYHEWDNVTTWVRRRVGRVRMVPSSAIVWRIEEGQ